LKLGPNSGHHVFSRFIWHYDQGGPVWPCLRVSYFYPETIWEGMEPDEALEGISPTIGWLMDWVGANQNCHMLKVFEPKASTLFSQTDRCRCTWLQTLERSHLLYWAAKPEKS